MKIPPRPQSHDTCSHDSSGPLISYRMDAGGVNYELYVVTNSNADPAPEAQAIHEPAPTAAAVEPTPHRPHRRAFSHAARHRPDSWPARSNPDDPAPPAGAAPGWPKTAAPRPIHKRDWPIDITDDVFADIVEEHLMVKVPRHLDLIPRLMDVIVGELRSFGVEDPYHDAGDVFLHVILAILSRNSDEPVRDVPGYLVAACERAARRVVKNNRTLVTLRNKDGNRLYIARRREYTPEKVAHLEDTSEANETQRRFYNYLIEQAIETLPEPERGLYLAYAHHSERPRRETFLKKRAGELAGMGIENINQFHHWISNVRLRIRAMQDRLLED